MYFIVFRSYQSVKEFKYKIKEFQDKMLTLFNFVSFLCI